MKKLLTILGAVGLTATMSSAVVACSTKKIEIVFNNLSSVTSSTWTGSRFGMFFESDFDFPNGIGEIKNKEKIAAYVAAGFKNSQKAYEQIMNETTAVTLYQKNSLTGDYAMIKEGQLPKLEPQNLFFRLEEKTEDLKILRKSDYLNLNFNPDSNIQEQIFDFETWFESQQSPKGIVIQDDKEKLTQEKEEKPNFKREKDWEVMDKFQQRIFHSWKSLRNGGSAISLADGAINSVLNYLGERLMRIEGYVTDYANFADMTTPLLPIKDQLFAAINQRENIDGKNQTRKAIIDEWFKIENVSSGDELPFHFNVLEKTMTINFSFKETKINN